MLRGSWMFGRVSFEVSALLGPPSACHCLECRKWTGHFEVDSDVSRESLRIDGEKYVKWYASSKKARRGFCSECASSLFWDPIHHDWISICLGAFDCETQRRLKKHIHVAEKSDYYEIPHGAEVHQH